MSVLQSTQFYKSASQPVLGILITFQFLLPALFSSCMKEDAQSMNLALSSPYGSSATSDTSVDIFTFNDDELQLLDSYQHITSLSSDKLEIRSQNGSKIIFICANSRKNIYDWGEIRTLKSLDKITADLRTEKRDRLLLTGTGRTSAGERECNIELRPVVSEILLKSIRCDFSNTSYEGESIRDARIYLTNVNCRCSITAQKDIMPAEIINPGGLDMDDVACFKEYDMIFQKLEEPIGETSICPEASLLCYPNTSEKETPGSPFTRLVIEGRIGEDTYWWPIDINRDPQVADKGIERNVCYIYDITIKRKGTADPDIPINAEDVEIKMTTTKWKELKDCPVRF